MNRPCFLLLTVIAAFALQVSDAASQEALEVEYEQLDAAGLSDPLVTAPDLKLRVHGIRTRFVLPLWRAREGHTELFVQPAYDLVAIDYTDDNPSAAGFRPERLHDLALRFALRRQLALRWKLLLTAEPSLVSDLKNIDGNHFNFSGGAFALLEISPQLSWRFGVLFENDFGEPLPLPAVQFNWTGRNLNLQVNLPQSIALWSPILRPLEVGLLARVQGNHYRIGEDYALPAGISTQDGRIKYSLITVGPSTRLRVAGPLDIRLDAGAALARRFEVFDQEDRERLQLEPERTWFFRGSLRLRH